jgi:hypothetical protein
MTAFLRQDARGAGRTKLEDAHHRHHWLGPDTPCEGHPCIVLTNAYNTNLSPPDKRSKKRARRFRRALCQTNNVGYGVQVAFNDTPEKAV